MRNGQLIGVVVLVRPGQPKGRDGAHHQSRIELPKEIISDPPRGHRTRRIVLHQDIRPAYESMQVALLMVEVEGDTSFVGIEIEEQATSFRVHHTAWERAA